MGMPELSLTEYIEKLHEKYYVFERDKYVMVKENNIDLNLDQAKELITYNNFKGQRDLDPKLVQEYKEKMLIGLWHLSHIAIALTPLNTTVLPNGQHTLTAYIEACAIMPNLTIRVVISKYKCPTAQSVTLLYQQFDNYARTEKTHLKTEVALIGNKTLEDNPNLQKALNSAAKVLHKDEVKDAPRGQKARIINFVLHEVEFINDVLKLKGKWYLDRTAVIVPLIEMHRVNKELAVTFANAIGEESKPSEYSPSNAFKITYDIRELLKKYNITRPRRGGKPYITNQECRYIMHCAWNAIVQDKEYKIPDLEKFRKIVDRKGFPPYPPLLSEPPKPRKPRKKKGKP